MEIPPPPHKGGRGRGDREWRYLGEGGDREWRYLLLLTREGEGKGIGNGDTCSSSEGDKRGG